MALKEETALAIKAESASEILELAGRIDGIEASRVYGWAWCAARPRARLGIEVYAEGELVAHATADGARVDLRRNGVGDGAHAFDVSLPNGIVDKGVPLRIVAIHPEGGKNLELRLSTGEERAAEAAFAAPIGPIIDRLEVTIAIQRRLQAGQTQSLRELVTAARRLSNMASGDSVMRAVQEVRAAQEAAHNRLSELEVIMVRFDGLIGEFHRRLLALSRHDPNGIRGHLLLISTAVGIVIGVAIMAALRL